MTATNGTQPNLSTSRSRTLEWFIIAILHFESFLLHKLSETNI